MTTTARGGMYPSDADNKNKTTSQVAYNGVTDTVYNADGIQASKSSVGTTSIEDTVYDTDGRTALSKLKLDKTSASLEAGTASVKVYNTTGNVEIKAGTVNGVQGNVTLSGKNVNLDGNGLTLYKDVNGTKTSYATLTASGGLTIYGDNGTSSNSTLSKSGLNVNGTSTSTIKTINSENATIAQSQVSTSGVADTVYDANTGKQTSKSSVGTTSILDTVYDTNGSTTLASSNISKASVKNSNDRYGSVSLSTAKYGDAQFGDHGYLGDKQLGDTNLTMDGNANKVSITSNSYGYSKATGAQVRNYNKQASITVDGNNGNVTLQSNKYGIVTTKPDGTKGNAQLENSSLKIDGNKVALSANNNEYDESGKRTSTNTSMTLDGSTGIVSLSGKNVNLDGNGLTLYKDNAEGTKTSYAILNSSGLSINNNANFDKFGTNSYNTTFTASNSQQSYSLEKWTAGNLENKVSSKLDTSGLTTTVQSKGNDAGIENTNSTKNKTTSQVAYNGVTDTVYDANGKKTSYSNVGTTSITDTVYDTDGNTILASSSISKSGKIGKIALTTNKYDEDGNKTTSSLTLDGENVLFSGKNATLSGSTLTLKDGSNNTARLTATGLTFTDASGQPIGGVSSTGAISGTSLNITAKNDAGNKTISKVDATSVTDTVYGTDGTTQVASSSVGINGISNNTNISGIAIKDDVNNTKRMTTSIAQDKNGVNISSTKYNVYNDGTSKVQTIDGISTISVNGAKTTISGSGNYEYKKDENGKLILDDKGNPIRSSNTSASLSVDGDTGTISLSGKNASLSNSTFTLKDITSGKSVASLGTSGLSLNKVNSDGTTANYGTWNSSGLTVTATNTTGNKTTSQVSATGVTDRVYDTDGKTQVAYSSVGTGGISNTTSLKTTTGKTDTAINQNTSGVGISSTKYDTNNNVTDKTSLTMNGSANNITSIKYNDSNKTAETTFVSVNGGTSSITSYGNYVYGEDGKATSYNQASMSLNGNTGIATIRGGSNTASSTLTLNEAGVGLSGKNVNLSDSTLTLKNETSGNTVASLGTNGLSLNKVNSDGTTTNYGTWNSNGLTLKDTDGKTATLTTSGLTLKDENGTQIGGINTAGAITGTSLNITAKNDAGNKTTSTVGATGVTDAVYGTDGTRVAYSNVGTGGITNSTNISGIAIKDDEYNTKTMSTSIAQNANGVSISSNKYNVYNDGTNTVQTTDGTSTISVNGAKTTISGYGYKYEKDENGKPILDEKGNPIRSSYTNASLSVDGESGIIGLSGKNVGLSANGLTLYKDVEGVKTQYASLTAGGLNVNGTGYTTIKSTNATTGAMGQSQVSYNGVTDTVTNAAGNKTTSTVSATGTIDQVYDTDGKTRIAYSNITTTGITDSFTKDGITNSVTTNANGTTFASTGNGSTTIKGGAITTNSITVAGNTIDGGFFDNIGKTNGNTAGIVRTEINGDWITSIEGALDISRSGNISLNADKLTYSYNDGKNSGTLGALANKVDDIYDRTQGIDYDKATGTTTIDGNLSVKDETTTGGTAGSTGETGTTPINGNITANTANIGGVQMGNNTVTATTGNFENVTVGGTEGTSINKDGVTVGDKKSDNYTSITNNDVVVNNNGSKTSLADVGNRVSGLESSVSSMNNRLSDVEDRIDKVGAMSAAIANLRTMGYDPEAPTEIAVGIGQYKSETGLALGIFHYPNQDFMLSASISTAGDEVMGGIGATWKLGRKSAAEKAKDEEARRLEKAEEMKKLAQDAKVKAQAERHAKLLAEREAQKIA